MQHIASDGRKNLHPTLLRDLLLVLLLSLLRYLRGSYIFIYDPLTLPLLVLLPNESVGSHMVLRDYIAQDKSIRRGGIAEWRGARESSSTFCETRDLAQFNLSTLVVLLHTPDASLHSS